MTTEWEVRIVDLRAFAEKSDITDVALQTQTLSL